MDGIYRSAAEGREVGEVDSRSAIAALVDTALRCADGAFRGPARPDRAEAGDGVARARR